MRSGSPQVEGWIWGLHSIEACLEEYPEVMLEIQVEEKCDKNIARKLEEALNRAGLRPKVVPSLPKFIAEKRTQGVGAHIRKFPTEHFVDLEDDLEKVFGDSGQAVLLDSIQDPRNYGAILRSAAAFGVKAVFVGQKDQAPLTGTVAQTSAGNVFRVRNVICRNLSETVTKIRDFGIKTVALDGAGTEIATLLKASQNLPILWVLGSEGEGLRKGLIEKCEETVRIPMQDGVESLNVSAAATIAFYLGRFR